MRGGQQADEAIYTRKLRLLRPLRRPRNDRQAKGFTIIELIVVIAIIAVLSSIVMVNVSQVRQKAKSARLLADFKQIELGAQIDYANNGNWADDVGAGELPRFAVIPNKTYSGDFQAGYYGSGYKYDWENWPPIGNCILVNLRDTSNNVIRRKPISCNGCPSECYSL